MSTTSELGPIDPQIVIRDGKTEKVFSAYNLVTSYDKLFARAVRTRGHLGPFIQQLERYDEREITEYRAAIALSADIAVQMLRTGMMKNSSVRRIRKNIDVFLTPTKTKTHGRPIYREEARRCGLKVDFIQNADPIWNVVHELHRRSDHYVSFGPITKSIESKSHSFFARVAEPEEED